MLGGDFSRRKLLSLIGSSLFGVLLFATVWMGVTGCAPRSSTEDSVGVPVVDDGEVASKVIYGVDGRADFFMASPAHQALADSTVALMQSSTLSSQSNGRYRVMADTLRSSHQLCASEPFGDQGAGAFCSGSLIGPDLVLTAGHCVTNASDCSGTRFVFGYRVEQEAVFPQDVNASEVYSCKQLLYREQKADGADFALIQLNRPVANHRPLALRRSGVASVGDSLLVIGHPSGLPTKITVGGRVRSVQTEHLVTNLDTYGGNSGSAVFNATTGLIEGVLVRGENDFVQQNGCYVSQRCTEDGCRGEDVTRIDYVLKHLPPEGDPTPLPPHPVPVVETSEFSVSANAAIPDNSIRGVTSQATVTEAVNGRQVLVAVNITHTYIGDLIVTLVDPSGKSIVLANRSGGSTDNIIGTFGLDLKASDSLGALGASSSGVWKLKVTDRARVDVGRLVSWKLIFKGNNP